MTTAESLHLSIYICNQNFAKSAFSINLHKFWLNWKYTYPPPRNCIWLALRYFANIFSFYIFGRLFTFGKKQIKCNCNKPEEPLELDMHDFSTSP